MKLHAQALEGGDRADKATSDEMTLWPCRAERPVNFPNRNRTSLSIEAHRISFSSCLHSWCQVLMTTTTRSADKKKINE